MLSKRNVRVLAPSEGNQTIGLKNGKLELRRLGPRCDAREHGGFVCLSPLPHHTMITSQLEGGRRDH